MNEMSMTLAKDHEGIHRPSDVVLFFRLLAKENKLLKFMKAASKGRHVWSFSFSLACR